MSFGRESSADRSMTKSIYKAENFDHNQSHHIDITKDLDSSNNSRDGDMARRSMQM